MDAAIPDKSQFHLYLLIGQSNMVGKNQIEPDDAKPHPRLLAMTRHYEWAEAKNPLYSTEECGVGPGWTFGITMAEHFPDAAIGIIPAAVGATPLLLWERGAQLYDHALYRVTRAIGRGTLKGVIWHQGEADARVEEYAMTYGSRLAMMIADLRADLGDPALPFIVGTLCEAFAAPFAKHVNEVLFRLPEHVPHTACALSTGLGHTGDTVHFTAKSARELGKRYAQEMLRVQAGCRCRD